jgi:hypothetical protein
MYGFAPVFALPGKKIAYPWRLQHLIAREGKPVLVGKYLPKGLPAFGKGERLFPPLV